MKSRGGRLGAFGSFDKRVRGWDYLGDPRPSAMRHACGNDLIYRCNSTTLEVGQGSSNFKGLLWIVGLALASAATFIAYVVAKINLGRTFSEPLDYAVAGTFWMMAILVLILGLFAFSLFVNDLFGYIEAPLRFDRARRKVYIWSARKAGPMVFDWDTIKAVRQSVSAGPYQVNRFQSVLLVDEDEHGEVRFEGKSPRVAQIGAALLDRDAALAAYEYCRVFMERGPQVLPPVDRYLVYRPRGWRTFFDIMNIIGGFMRSYPQLSKQKRSPGWLAFSVVLVAVFAFVLWPWQVSQGIALKLISRVPEWPAAFEEMAALGGPMLPPPGAEPSDLPMLAHERAIAAIWVVSAISVWGIVIWWLVR